MKKGIQNEPENSTPLPKRVIVYATSIMCFSIMVYSSVYSYLPHLVKSFYTPEVEVGYYVGFISSTMYLTQGCTSFLWGILADRVGINVAVRTAAISAAFSILAFGFTTSFKWALITRILEGATIGVTGVTKSLVLMHCDDTNTALALTITFSGYSFGYIIGSLTGGYLAFPSEKIPALTKDKFFMEFPIFLPNVIVTTGLLATVLLGFIILPKTSSTRNKWLVLSCLSYSLLGTVLIGFAELFPLFASSSLEYNGLGYTQSRLGLILFIISLVMFFVRLFFSSKIVNMFGSKQISLFSTATLAIVFPMLPLIQMLTNKTLQLTLVITYLLTIRYAKSLNLLTINIMVSNSVPTHQIGTANSIAASLSSFGFFLGALMAGIIYSWSLTNIKGIAGNNQALGFPFNQYFAFIVLSVICIVNAILIASFPEKLNRKFKSSELPSKINNKKN